MADTPDTIVGQIEARGMGILHLPAIGPQPLALIVDLDHDEGERLPSLRQDSILGVVLPSVRKSAFPHFPAALLLYLKHGRLT
jgi:HPr kinase/phosphorylase